MQLNVAVTICLSGYAKDGQVCRALYDRCSYSPIGSVQDWFTSRLTQIQLWKQQEPK